VIDLPASGHIQNINLATLKIAMDKGATLNAQNTFSKMILPVRATLAVALFEVALSRQ